MKATQAQKILSALKEAGSEGCHPQYFIETLHIYQYGARIHDVRLILGCECRHDYRCPGKEHVRNKDLKNGTTKFYYINENEEIGSSLRGYQEDYQKKAKEEREKERQNKLF